MIAVMLLSLAIFGAHAWMSWMDLPGNRSSGALSRSFMTGENGQRWVLPEALFLYPVRGYAHKSFTFCSIARGYCGCDCEADHDAIIEKINRSKGFTP